MIRSKSTIELCPIKLWCKVYVNGILKTVRFYLGCEKSKENPDLFYAVYRATKIVDKIDREGRLECAVMYRNDIENQPKFAQYSTTYGTWEYAEHTPNLKEPEGWCELEDRAREIETIYNDFLKKATNSNKQVIDIAA